MSMNPHRVSEVASICLRMASGIGEKRASEIAQLVSRGYFRMVQESDEWKVCVGLCNAHSLESMIHNVLGKDAEKILGGLSEDDRAELGFIARSKQEEPCFVWAWKAFCLFGRQFHSSHVTPKELMNV